MYIHFYSVLRARIKLSCELVLSDIGCPSIESRASRSRIGCCLPSNRVLSFPRDSDLIDVDVVVVKKTSID